MSAYAPAAGPVGAAAEPQLNSFLDYLPAELALSFKVWSILVDHHDVIHGRSCHGVAQVVLDDVHVAEAVFTRDRREHHKKRDVHQLHRRTHRSVVHAGGDELGERHFVAGHAWSSTCASEGTRERERWSERTDKREGRASETANERASE